MSDKENPTSGYDVCECGHYRHQHENGVGKCRMPDDTRDGFHPCLRFILSQRVEPATIRYCPSCKQFHLFACPIHGKSRPC